jgi:hypothetical protein
MKRSRFSDEQIIGIVKVQEAGMATAEVCRRHGISGATFYKWNLKYGGLEVPKILPWQSVSKMMAWVALRSASDGTRTSIPWRDMRYDRSPAPPFSGWRSEAASCSQPPPSTEPFRRQYG